MDKKIEIAKRAASFVVGMGTAKIVNDIIENNTADRESKTDKVAIKAGSVVIGSMAADATSSYTDRKIDEAVSWWNENIPHIRWHLKKD